MLRERDDSILQLKAETAQAASLHTQELDNLRARLADARGRQSEAQASMISDLQSQLRERAGEIEKLHGELRSSGSELERLKCEARSLDLRSSAAETAAVEAAKVATAEQWRRDLKRIEDVVRERDIELAGAKEQIERNQREMRRLEVDEHRAVQRAEGSRTEIENARQEAQQLREDVIEAERRLEDARTALRGEHAAKSLADANVRENQRELRALRDQLQQQAAETELLANEARRERNIVVENEDQIARLQQQVQTKEAECRQLRASSEVQAQQGDASLRRRWAELNEREQALSDRDRLTSERERLCAEAEAGLHERRRELRDDLQRLELAGLRAVVAEFTPTANRHNEPTLVQLSSTPRRRGELVDGSAVPMEVPPLPMSSLGSAQPELDGMEQIRDMVPAGRSEERLDTYAGTNIKEAGVDGAVEGSACIADNARLPLGTLADVRALGEATSTLDSRRRELRRERCALEELRKQWKSDLHRVQAGGSVQAQAVLNEIRFVLDDRTVNLNKLIDEHRVLERALSVQRGGNKPHALSAGLDTVDSIAAKTLKVRPDTGGAITPSSRNTAPTAAFAATTHDLDLLQRWRNLLSIGHQSPSSARPKSARAAYSASPRSSPGGERYVASLGRRTRNSRDMVDQHLSWLRNFQNETGARPHSARASTRFQPEGRP